MTKEVLITIAGMHTDAIDKGELNDGPIEVVTPASYFCKNGKHYILYDEVAEGIPGVTKNKIKITGDKVGEIMKSGITNTHMVFEKEKEHLTNYKTPYGQLMMGIHTKHIEILEEEDRIFAEIHYNLDVNEEAIAECEIQINVQPKSVGLTV